MAARAQEPLPETLGVVISGMTIDKFDRDKLARRTATEFSKYERKIATRLGNFAVTPTTFKKDNMGNYSLQRTSLVAQFLYWGAAVNTLIKFGFLCVLISGYLGSIPFLDKIAALDYFLCVGIATFGGFIWGSRYPIHGKVPELSNKSYIFVYIAKCCSFQKLSILFGSSKIQSTRSSDFPPI